MLRLARVMFAWVMCAYTRLSSRRLGFVLMYHGVSADPGPSGMGATFTAREFERHLAHLRHWYAVVPLHELQSAVAERRRGQRLPLALTFDDDLSSHATIVGPALRRRRLPATFFLSGTWAEGRAHWWLDLESCSRRPDDWMAITRSLGVRWSWVVDASMPALRQAIEGLSAAERAAFTEDLRDVVGPAASSTMLLSGTEAKGLASDGFEIGWHTLAHDALRGLPTEAVMRALVDGRDRVEAVAGRSPVTIAYPHGSADVRVAHCARLAGFQRGVTCDGSPVRADHDPMLLDRVDAGVPLDRLMARMARASVV